MSQRSRPVQTKGGIGDDDNVENTICPASKVESGQDEEACEQDLSNVVYHLILEGLDVSYAVDSDANVVVETVSLPSRLPSSDEM